MNRTPFTAILIVFLLMAGCGGGASVDSRPDADEPNEPGVAEPEVPADDDAPPVVLTAPLELRVTRYSSTAAELFWQQPDDADPSWLYRVSMDATELALVASSSHYIEGLQPGVSYRLSVTSVDPQGNVSEAASVVMSAEVDVPPPVFDFELRADRTRAELREGNADGTTFVIDALPEGNEAIAVQVLPQQAEDASDVLVSVDRQELDASQSRAMVTFTLPVGLRPRQAQERRFNLIASSGDEVRILELILDDKPIEAPDVYLLIGQSNMVGSSKSGAKDVSAGGLDERNDRLWQLNVAPNNRGIFAGFDDFLNESNTAIEPRYILAEDPLHDPRNPVVEFKGGTSIGPGLSFAKAALNETSQHIYLVPAAWGATGFCLVSDDLLAWNAGEHDNSSLGGTALLERALSRLRITMRDTGGILRGILWHQGGADSNDQACADAYAENIRLMVERLRREAPVDARGEQARGSQAPIPFIVATQSRGSDHRGDFSSWPSTKQQVDAVHRGIASLLPYTDWVNNDDLVPPAYPCGSSSCVHFGAEANREIGRRFHEALKRIWER